MIKWVKVATGTCRGLKDVPKGARIEEVNGTYCYNVCPRCGRPVLDGQDFHLDMATGKALHSACVAGRRNKRGKL